MTKKTLTLYGDSYVSPSAKWTTSLQKRLPDYHLRALGKGGSNQYYSITRWKNDLEEMIDHHTIIWNFTWFSRRYSSMLYRHEQMCAFSELRDFTDYGQDPAIRTPEDVEKFKQCLEDYYQYIYDPPWAMFDYELELKYILDLPRQYPKINFIFIPNHEFAREVATRHFTQGLLLDFAFAEISDREPNSPGPMQVNCGRPGHLNDNNHVIFAKRMQEYVVNYDRYRDQIVEFDLAGFDII